MIVWLASFAFADAISKFPPLEWLYEGIKIASVIVITIHYLANCIIEINKNKKNFISEIFSSKSEKKGDEV